MSETLLIAAAGYVVTLLVAVGGWVFGYRMQTEAHRLARLEKKVNQLETEVRDNAYLGEVTTKYDSLFKVGGPRRRCSTKALAEREVQRRRQSRAGKGRAS